MHPLDPSAVFEPSDLVELVLELLLRDPLEPLLPDNSVILFLFSSVVDDFLAPLRPYGRGVLDALLHLFLGLDAPLDVLHNFNFFFLDGFFFADLDLREYGVTSCCGGFTSLTRVVSRNDGRGWFLF